MRPIPLYVFSFVGSTFSGTLQSISDAMATEILSKSTPDAIWDRFPTGERVLGVALVTIPICNNTYVDVIILI